MNPVKFPEANSTFGPPAGLEESQVQTVAAYVGQIERGSVEGMSVVVVAWQPTPAELEVLNAGGAIFLSVIGGLPPHFLTTDFQSATHPA